MGEREHILALSIHHIVVDEWSMGVLQQEMALLYAAYVQGQESPLQEMPLQYAEYTLWQVQWLRAELFVRQMEYWKKQLAGMPEFLELPTDKPGPAIPQHRGSTEVVTIDREYWEKMKLFSRQEGASVFMIVLAIYQVLLSRYTGQTDFGVGTPITNRNHLRMEGMIGFCVNTLIMRADLRGEPTFREVLRRVRKATLEAFDHQDLPLEKLVEEFSPERQISGSPLFQVMFTFVSGKAAPPEFPGVEMRPIVPETATSKYDLSLLAVDNEIPMLLFNYDTGLFEADTIQQMLHHFGRLLAFAIAGPELRICDLPMLTQDETQQLLVEWNPAEIQLGQKCVHELFEEQVRRTPNAPAIVFEDASLTYGELNRRANQLAHYLRTIGVKPETRVAIGLERGLEMVVGMVAVLKAGGAYVPLDLSYPVERLRLFWRTVLRWRCWCAMNGRGWRIWQRGIHEGIQIIDLANEDVFTNLPETNLEPCETGVDPENLACVIYTSGSTGEPKGSEIPHRSIPGFIFGTDYVRFDEETVLLQHSLRELGCIHAGAMAGVAERRTERAGAAASLERGRNQGVRAGPGSEYAMVDGGAVQLNCGKRCEVSGRSEVSDDRGRNSLGEAYPAGEGSVAWNASGERVWAIGMHGVQQLLCSAGRVAGDDAIAPDRQTDWRPADVCAGCGDERGAHRSGGGSFYRGSKCSAGIFAASGFDGGAVCAGSV